MWPRTEVSRLARAQYWETLNLYITLLSMGSLALDPQHTLRDYQTLAITVGHLVEHFEGAAHRAKLEHAVAECTGL